MDRQDQLPNPGHGLLQVERSTLEDSDLDSVAVLPQGPLSAQTLPEFMACSLCGETKPLTKFYVRKSGVHRKDCSSCCVNRSRVTKERNPERSKANTKASYLRHRDRNLAERKVWYANNPESVLKSRLVKYNITPEQYRQLLLDQDNSCAICGRSPEENGQRLGVDHDHSCCVGKRSCGKCVRGLLCDRCNMKILGPAEDDPEILINAANYILQRRDRLACSNRS